VSVCASSAGVRLLQTRMDCSCCHLDAMLYDYTRVHLMLTDIFSTGFNGDWKNFFSETSGVADETARTCDREGNEISGNEWEWL